MCCCTDTTAIPHPVGQGPGARVCNEWRAGQACICSLGSIFFIRPLYCGPGHYPLWPQQPLRGAFSPSVGAFSGKLVSILSPFPLS